MPDFILWILGTAIFIAALCISIGLHEGGHMVVAKWCKLKVSEFFVGFGPKMFSFKKGETEYGARWIPLGGFVRIEDRRFDDKTYENASLAHVHPFKRIMIFLAGPAVNIVLGIGLVLTAIMMIPYQAPTTKIDLVSSCEASVQMYGKEVCGASKTGLKQGDNVVSIDGVKVESLDEIKSHIAGKETVKISAISESGETKEYSVDVVSGALGITVTTEDAYRTVFEAATYVESIVKSSLEAITKIPETAPSVATSIVTGERDEEAPGSVVSVGKAYGNVATSEEPVRDKVTSYILITGLFNLSLGILNLIPIIPLDGGRIAIAVYDWFRMGFRKVIKKEYKPVGQKAFMVMSVASSIVVFGFMIMLVASDFSLLFRGNL